MTADPTHAENRLKRRALLLVLAVGLGLMGLKFLAWWLTGSVAILTDALESIINIAANAFALYSIYLASLPKDSNHPYGHGKVEFFAAGFEGGMILLAGVSIFIKAILSLLDPQPVQELPEGIAITAFTGVVNLGLGLFLLRRGKRLGSVTLEADGKHLLTDSYSNAGLLVGLALIYFTKIVWLDAVVAIALAVVIVITGVRLLRFSVARLMDEQDPEMIDRVLAVLVAHRRPQWIDVHNLRVQQYGNHLHIDAHVTLPYYYDLRRYHQEITEIEAIIGQELGNQIEIFIHADPCTPGCCTLCSVHNCAKRSAPTFRQVPWTPQNTTENRKHSRTNMPDGAQHAA